MSAEQNQLLESKRNFLEQRILAIEKYEICLGLQPHAEFWGILAGSAVIVLPFLMLASVVPASLPFFIIIITSLAFGAFFFRIAGHCEEYVKDELSKIDYIDHAIAAIDKKLNQHHAAEQSMMYSQLLFTGQLNKPSINATPAQHHAAEPSLIYSQLLFTGQLAKPSTSTKANADDAPTDLLPPEYNQIFS